MFRSTLAFALLTAASISAHATLVMPDFANVPTGWITDRYEPDSFSNIGTFQGRSNVLEIGISSADAYNNRPAGYQSTFYNTQGRQHAISGGAGSILAADLYIDASWANAANGNVRTDMWGVTTDGIGVSGYPIIGFTNYGGSARYRAWEDNAGSWADLATPVAYNAWTSFEILFTGTSYEYFINGTMVYTDITTNGSIGFSAVIMQAYNFGGDPSITGANARDYTVHWSNSVPEPASPALLALGLAGLIMTRRQPVVEYATRRMD